MHRRLPVSELHASGVRFLSVCRCEKPHKRLWGGKSISRRVPCFTPVESPESNGMAEAFVKAFKRDYVRISSIPDAATAMALIDTWTEDPHSWLGYR